MMRSAHFGKLDEYFAMMMKGGDIDGKEKDVYELAVKAFINDISCNGLPKIRRERYNRELHCSLATFELIGYAEQMSEKKREYYP